MWISAHGHQLPFEHVAKHYAQAYDKSMMIPFSKAVDPMDQRAMLIAEIDEEGHVAWLWRADHGKRPKPVQDAATCLREIDSLTIFGTSKPTVEAWLTQQSTQQE